MKDRIKETILKLSFLRETYFLISRKKLNKAKVDKKIAALKKSCDKKVAVLPVIVSLTSYGQRQKDLKYTLYSIVSQSMKAEKIIVWISENESVPEEIKLFEPFCVEVKFCKDLRSYKKLVPALEVFGDRIIVTADDDIFYPKNWLKNLWEAHLRFPGAKVCTKAREVNILDGKVLPYRMWKQGKGYSVWGKKLFPLGYGGILYPEHAFDGLNEIMAPAIFEKYCPFADDIWFYFSGLKNGLETVMAKYEGPVKYVDIYKEYGLNGADSLQKVNVQGNRNDQQFEEAMKFFCNNFSEKTEDYKVSIVVPNFNGEKYIEETIKSVINQTHENWEMLIVDDCSTDSSIQIAKKYGAEDSRIRIFENERQMGAAFSRNRALDEAEGDFVAFLDSDDLWEKNKLEVQLKFMLEKDVDFCYSSYRLIDENGNKLGRCTRVPKKVSYRKMLFHDFTGCLTVIYRRKLFQKIRSFDLKNNNDYGLFLQILKDARNACGIDQVLASYRIREGGISRKKLKKVVPFYELMHEHLGYGMIFSSFFLFTNILIGKLWKYRREI